MKTLDDYFTDWEAHVFGYGYGSGEEHVIPALKRFFVLCPANSGYDYQTLEVKLTPAVAWLLINVLAHADLLEYGTSPRYAWLTERGRALKQYLDSKSAEELQAILARDYDRHCYPDHCNCDDGPCHNPFWREYK